ncbi:MAG: hypothetical protein IID46_05055 [Planctomycetes bacterium]|nr:hypothetical protein [Planctomycetota bacterium]
MPEISFLVQPVAHLNLDALEELPVYLVTGHQAHYDPDDKARMIAKYPYRPSDLVRLNHTHPSELAGRQKRPTETVSLYLIK